MKINFTPPEKGINIPEARRIVLGRDIRLVIACHPDDFSEAEKIAQNEGFILKNLLELSSPDAELP